MEHMFDWLTPEMILEPALEIAAWLLAYTKRIEADAWRSLLTESPPALRLFFVLAALLMSIDAARRWVRRRLGVRV